MNLARGIAAVLPFFAAAAAAQTFVIQPSIAVTETYSDNVLLLPEGRERAGWVTDIVPQLRARYSSAAAAALLDFRLHELAYSVDPAPSRRQVYLDSAGSFKAIEGLLRIDGRAGISQLSRSAFDPTFSATSAAATNRVETRLLQASPVLSGRIGSLAEYDARLTGSDLRTDDPALPDTREVDFIAGIRSPKSSARLGWAVDAIARNVRNDTGGRVDDTRGRLSLTYLVAYNFRVAVSGGYESTDALGTRTQQRSYGTGFEWSPTERTQLAGVYEDRFFGRGHSLVGTHRTPRTLWRIASKSEATLLPALSLGASAFTLDAMLSDLLASSVPDPAARAAATQRRLDEAGIPTASPITGVLLALRPTRERETRASVAMIGLNNTVSLAVLRREQRSLGQALVGFPGLEEVRQTGANADWSTRLTRLTALALSATWVSTEGLAASAQRSRQRTATAQLTSRLTPKTRVALGVRHWEFDTTGLLGDYRENAIFATLSLAP